LLLLKRPYPTELLPPNLHRSPNSRTYQARVTICILNTKEQSKKRNGKPQKCQGYKKNRTGNRNGNGIKMEMKTQMERKTGRQAGREAGRHASRQGNWKKRQNKGEDEKEGMKRNVKQ
jgi:hypothetical protein